jgi:cellulose synthase/poly-beta-1,6-N-acetylglucosamine synthase-like glycosyltransferase
LGRRGRGKGGPTLFWLSLITVFYTYAVYPLLLWVLTKGRRTDPPPTNDAGLPAVDLIVAAREEAGTIEHLLASCARLEYPSDRLQITVVVTGESKATTAAVESCRPALESAGIGLQALIGDPADPSKSAALNQAISCTSGELLVFTDANVRLDSRAIATLVSWFASPQIGAVAGRKRAFREGGGMSSEGDRAYWSYEAFIKEREALLHSVAGADGALYAVRREAYRPTASCADDLAVSLAVTGQGKRIAFARDAVAYESSTRRLGDEFRRRLRTLSCALDELWRSRTLVSAGGPVFAWIVVSHKIMRYLAAYALVGMLAGSAAARGRFYRSVFLLQVLGGAVAVLAGVVAAAGKVRPAVAVPLYGLAAQAAAILAPLRLVRRRHRDWTPTPR